MHTIEYRFSTTWRIEAPLPAVWAAVHDSSRWPRWWKSVERVIEVAPGTGEGVGAVHRYIWKGALPYRLVFDMQVTRIEPLVALEGDASGDVQGTGRWFFSHDGSATIVRYDWHVRTSRPWMNLLAPIARPVFQWNHDAVMREGGESLARLLHARLLSIDHA
ncbi:SRPBCC family protein [Paraburkholderia sp. GAS334]|uniref:SRPBCC family protein n=1 Tax=Paraburkholderia sp. GAS334 TaxID=3035131 RepID=UPI003D254CCC